MKSHKNYCVDCGKLLSRPDAKRCLSCAKKGKRNINYKHGKSYNNKCIDCGKKISKNGIRCHSCSRKKYLNNKNNNYFYKDGRTLKKYYCKNCGKEIGLSSALYGSGLCRSCAKKGIKITWSNKISKSLIKSKKFKGKNNPMYGKLTHGKRQYFKGSCMRSSWEVKYAKYLDENNIKWEYEPKTFDLGDMTYTPDFYLPEKDLYIEIKGYWREKAIIKFTCFKKQYPKENIKVLMKKELQKLNIIA